MSPAIALLLLKIITMPMHFRHLGMNDHRKRTNNGARLKTLIFSPHANR